MSTVAAPPFVADGVQVSLWNIERELRRQLAPSVNDADHSVHLARMSNLVVYCDSDARAIEIASEIASVIAVHPARVLFLVGLPAGAPSDGDQVMAWVRAWCRRGSGHQQICTEQITLRASGAGLERLPFSVRELLLGDLPTNLWWAASQPPAFGGALLYDLSEPVEQMVYDSIGWLEPAKAVAATGAWLGKFECPRAGCRHRVASDLNWRRLKYWRRLVGQALSPATAPGAIESITDVQVEHGPHAVVQAWQLVSWLAARLEWRVQTGSVQPGVEIAWQFAAPQGAVRVGIKRLSDGPSVVRSMRVACTINGQPGALKFTDQDGEHLEIAPEGIDATPRTVIVKREGLADLAGRQLSDREFDPVFRESMDFAQILAQSVLSS